MEHTHVEIADLVNRIDTGEIRLPEIQRGYVWKPPQVAYLIDSLYRRYPSGSMLLWRPTAEVLERATRIVPSDAKPLGQVQYLLDGQQRLTSLHRVMHRHPRAQVVFNVESERFQIQSALTAKDPRWVLVADVLTSEKLGPIRKRIREELPGLDEDDVQDCLLQLQAVAKYRYYLEILTDLSYEEVAQIFVRVNSRGRSLKTVDLSLATLSARWPGIVAKIEKQHDECKARGWPKIDATFLVRALAATATPAATLPQLPETPIGELEAGWKRVRAGVDWLMRLLEQNAYIRSSTLIPSMNALIALVTLLGRKAEDKSKPLEDADALIYWLLAVWVTGRYSAAADTKIAADSLAARSDDPVTSLYGTAGLLETPLVISPTHLVGKGAGSAYFLLSFLAAKRRHATDWWHGVEISEQSGGGGFSIEYHHIHPQVTLRGTYGKGEINDLANLAFISATANKKIGGRSPKEYFSELLDTASDKDVLSPHLVPLDPDVRVAGNYRSFLKQRRELLATEMNAVIESVRPKWVIEEGVRPDEPQRAVDLALYQGTEPRLGFEVRVNGDVFRANVLLSEIERFIRDVDDGITATLEVAEAIAVVEPGQDEVVVPVGPTLLTGSLDEWEAVLDRERADAIYESVELPAASPAWKGLAEPFPIVESE